MDNILKEVLSIQNEELEKQDIVQVVGKQKFQEFLASEIRAYRDALSILTVPEYRKNAPTKAQQEAQKEEQEEKNAEYRKKHPETFLGKLFGTIFMLPLAYILIAVMWLFIYALYLIPSLLVVAILLFVVYIFLDKSSDFFTLYKENEWIIFSILSLILSMILYIRSSIKSAKKKSEDTAYNEEVEIKHKKAEALRNNPDFIFYRDNSERILGSKYFNLTCLEKFFDYFSNGRCNSLLEAKNLLERENEIRSIRNEIDDVRRLASSALARSSNIGASSSQTDKAMKNINRQISEIKDHTGML